jgi:hypothetical protein
MAKMGRPRIEIDKAMFEKLCSIMCTLTDIAGFFDCSVDTIENWCKRIYGETFSETYKKKCAPGKVSLRRKQFETAMKGSVPMLIFLGKQHLGQRDIPLEDDAQRPIASVYKLYDANKSNSEAG